MPVGCWRTSYTEYQIIPDCPHISRNDGVPGAFCGRRGIRERTMESGSENRRIPDSTRPSGRNHFYHFSKISKSFFLAIRDRKKYRMGIRRPDSQFFFKKLGIRLPDSKSIFQKHLMYNFLVVSPSVPPPPFETRIADQYFLRHISEEVALSTAAVGVQSPSNHPHQRLPCFLVVSHSRWFDC
jgi:hypothetical protein